MEQWTRLREESGVLSRLIGRRQCVLTLRHVLETRWLPAVAARATTDPVLVRAPGAATCWSPAHAA